MLKIDPNIDTSVYIFQHLFLCRIPYIASMSVDYIKIFGIPSTGDKEIDSEIGKQNITTMLPISEMARYYSEGVNISIVNRSDVKDIYILVNNHLMRWKKHVEYSLNLGNAPFEDLIKLDQFADAVYAEAKFDFETEINQTPFMQYMSEAIRTNKKNFFKSANVVQSYDRDGNLRIHGAEDKVYPERQSLSDIFKNRRIGNKHF